MDKVYDKRLLCFQPSKVFLIKIHCKQEKWIILSSQLQFQHLSTNCKFQSQCKLWHWCDPEFATNCDTSWILSPVTLTILWPQSQPALFGDIFSVFEPLKRLMSASGSNYFKKKNQQKINFASQGSKSFDHFTLSLMHLKLCYIHGTEADIERFTFSGPELFVKQIWTFTWRTLSSLEPYLTSMERVLLTKMPSMHSAYGHLPEAKSLGGTMLSQSLWPLSNYLISIMLFTLQAFNATCRGLSLMPRKRFPHSTSIPTWRLDSDGV